jgi:Leucine-rich repeat (LRR) protein
VLLSNSIFEELSEAGISEEFLKHHSGAEDLSQVEHLDLQVDATSGGQHVELIGQLMPSLQELRLNESSIPSVRDLGTGLANLRILFLCRSSLQDLGGISALSSLEELYVSFNDIKEIYHLVTHESLQVLDLEGNLVSDFGEVQSLQALGTLRDLNLSANPVWRVEGVSRERVVRALPQLEVLDDLPCGDSTIQDQPLLEHDLELDMGESLDEVRQLLAVSVGSPSGLGAKTADAEEENGLSQLLRRAGRTPQGGSPEKAPAGEAVRASRLESDKHARG